MGPLKASSLRVGGDGDLWPSSGELNSFLNPDCSSMSSSLSTCSNSPSDTGLVARGSGLLPWSVGDVMGVACSSWMPGVEGVSTPVGGSGVAWITGGGGDGRLSEKDLDETEEADRFPRPGDLNLTKGGDGVDCRPADNCPLSWLSSDTCCSLLTRNMIFLTSGDAWRRDLLCCFF